MSHVASTLKSRRSFVSRSVQPDFVQPAVQPGPFEADAPLDLDLRQLRHHTKNALQRIIGLISEIPGLCDTPAGEQVARELEHRIRLSATISNALFGLTESPGPMADRLRQLAGAIVDMMRAADQVIRV